MSEDLAEQYRTEDNLRTRIQTHERYTVGPKLEDAVDDALALKGEEDLLDVGTGPGDFPSRLSNAGHRGRLVGIDGSLGMVQTARRKYPRVEFVHGDAQNLPFPTQSFDVVTARHMLYHVPDIPRALREFQRVLRKGGRFLAVTNSANMLLEYRNAIHEAGSRADVDASTIVREMIGTSTFTEENAPALVKQVFGSAEVRSVDSALVFISAKPVIKYFLSSFSSNAMSRENWNRITEMLRKVVAEKLADGPWRVEKRVVMIIAPRLEAR